MLIRGVAVIGGPARHTLLFSRIQRIQSEGFSMNPGLHTQVTPTRTMQGGMVLNMEKTGENQIIQQLNSCFELLNPRVG